MPLQHCSSANEHADDSVSRQFKVAQVPDCKDTKPVPVCDTPIHSGTFKFLTSHMQHNASLVKNEQSKTLQLHSS